MTPSGTSTSLTSRINGMAAHNTHTHTCLIHISRWSRHPLRCSIILFSVTSHIRSQVQNSSQASTTGYSGVAFAARLCGEGEGWLPPAGGVRGGNHVTPRGSRGGAPLHTPLPVSLLAVANPRVNSARSPRGATTERFLRQRRCLADAAGWPTGFRVCWMPRSSGRWQRDQGLAGEGRRKERE